MYQMSGFLRKALRMLWNSALRLPDSEPHQSLSLPSVGKSVCLRPFQPLLYPFHYLTHQVQSVLSPAGYHPATLVLLRTYSLINYSMMMCCLVRVPFLAHVCDFSASLEWLQGLTLKCGISGHLGLHRRILSTVMSLNFHCTKSMVCIEVALFKGWFEPMNPDLH